jgi:hypothetical protein
MALDSFDLVITGVQIAGSLVGAAPVPQLHISLRSRDDELEITGTLDLLAAGPDEVGKGAWTLYSRNHLHAEIGVVEDSIFRVWQICSPFRPVSSFVARPGENAQFVMSPIAMRPTDETWLITSITGPKIVERERTFFGRFELSIRAGFGELLV